MIMNQTKFIVRLGVALMLLGGPLCVSAYAAPTKADADQNVGKTVTGRGVTFRI